MSLVRRPINPREKCHHKQQAMLVKQTPRTTKGTALKPSFVQARVQTASKQNCVVVKGRDTPLEILLSGPTVCTAPLYSPGLKQITNLPPEKRRPSHNGLVDCWSHVCDSATRYLLASCSTQSQIIRCGMCVNSSAPFACDSSPTGLVFSGFLLLLFFV